MAEKKAILSLDGSKFQKGIDNALGGIGKLTGKALSLGSLIGTFVGIGSAAALMGKAIQEAANFETTQIAFETLIGNTKLAHQTLNELVDFAASTPLEMSDIAPAAKKLLAYGFAAQEVNDQLRMLGDVSTGLGVPLGDLAYIYGTLQVQGRAFSRDILQFTNRGVPLISSLSQVLGVAESKILDMVTAGKIGFPEVEKAFQVMTGKGGAFENMMERQSRTWNGLMAKLRDGVNIVLRELATPLLAAWKPDLESAVNFLDTLEAKAKAAGETIAGMFKTGRIGEVAGLALQIGFAGAINFLAGGLRALADTFPELFETFFSNEFAAVVVTGFTGVALKISELLIRAFETPLRYLSAGIQNAFEQSLDFAQPRWKKDKAAELDAEAARLNAESDDYRRRAEMKRASGNYSDSEIRFDEREAARLGLLAAQTEAQRARLGLVARSFQEVFNTTEIPSFLDPSKLANLGNAFLQEAADNLPDLTERIGEIYRKAADRGVQPMDIANDAQARQQLAALLEELRAAGVATAGAGVNREGLPPIPGETAFGKVIASTLAQVGGGGRFYSGGDPILNEERRRTAIVERESKRQTELIAKAIDGGIVRVVPQFA